LAEFDARRLYAPAGFSSTFKYCLEVLRLSEDAAFNRIEAARTARRFPLVVDMLLAGMLSPTTTRLLARQLTPENHEELLAAAAGKSKHDVERLLAGLFPQPDVLPSVRRVPVKTAVTALSRGDAEPVPAPGPVQVPMPPSVDRAETPCVAAPPFRRPVVRPLAAER
jgi:hypothetical protein